MNETGEETFEMLFSSDTKEFDEELHSEMEKIILLEDLPELKKLTYPLIQPLLIEEYEKRI